MIKRESVTIKEVARQAGVSTQTVSRVLNHHPDVAPETRLRVLNVIEKLDYHPSAVARSLIQRRSWMLGIVTAGLKFIGPSQTLKGIIEQADRMGYALLLKELPGFDTPDIDSVFQALLSRQVDGILWAVPEIGTNRDWIHPKVDALPVPVIFLNTRPRPGITSIAIDNAHGACLATQHLFKCGYRRIGHISGPMDWWEACERFKGWQETLAKAGEAVREFYSVSGDWSSASGEQAMRKLLFQYPDVQAVFVANDQMALGALHVAWEQGLRVPHELGIVGFDGIPEAAYFLPPLTTIDQDPIAMGKAAVDELVAAIEAGQQRIKDEGEIVQGRSIMLQPRLVARESTGFF